MAAGGNYTSLKNAINKFNLDISHFTGQGHLKDKTYDWRKRVLSEILVYGKNENTWRLKLRLIQANMKKHKCENCNRTKWLKQPVPLELHHIDGDTKNNVIENLQLLCPNCHTFTKNYRGKKKRK